MYIIKSRKWSANTVSVEIIETVVVLLIRVLIGPSERSFGQVLAGDDIIEQ